MTRSADHLLDRQELLAALRQFFTLSGLSYAATARLLGLSESALQHWRKGTRSPKEVHWRMKYKPALVRYLDERDTRRRKMLSSSYEVPLTRNDR